VLQNKPSHWAEVPIGEVLNYLDEQVMFDDMAEYITITVKRRHGGLEAREKLFGHEIKTKKQYRLHRGAFIISRVQCWHAAFAIVPDDIPDNMIASQNYDQFEISPKVDNRFFWWLSHSPQFIETVRSSASGVVIEKLVFNRDAWLQKTIPLPPLDEQRRIVAHIESLARQVNEAQRLREEADAAANALTAAETTLIFGKLNDYPKIQLGKLGDNGSNPIQTGPFGSQLLTTEFVDDGVPVLNVGNVQPDGLKLSKLDHVTPEKATTLARYSLQENDLLFARTGATLGKVCLLPKGCDGWLMTGHLFRVRFDSSRCNPRYAFVALRGAESVRKQVFGQIRGATRPGFNTTLLSRVELPLPPLDEQQRIVAYLDDLQTKVNALRELQSASEEELSALMPSILDKAFKGEL
jgi:type I restriction enzyme S subunit